MHGTEPGEKGFSFDVGVEVELVEDGQKGHYVVIVDELMKGIDNCGLGVLWLWCWWY